MDTAMKSLVIFVLLMLAVPAFATQYYVDNCVVTGNNSNNGTSPSTPWLTLAKVAASSFSAGDIISLEKTCTWVETLAWGSSSGSAGSPITINAYGSGAQPILDCSAIAT